VEEVATLVASRWGASDSIRITPDHSSMHEAQLLQLNSTKANTLLNWNTRWNFQETMNHTIDWYRAWNDGKTVEDLTTQDIEDYLSA
jgi:CDP-glucose 4,6-dehydratase